MGSSSYVSHFFRIRKRGSEGLKKVREEEVVGGVIIICFPLFRDDLFQLPPQQPQPLVPVTDEPSVRVVGLTVDEPSDQSAPTVEDVHPIPSDRLNPPHDPSSLVTDGDEFL